MIIGILVFMAGLAAFILGFTSWIDWKDSNDKASRDLLTLQYLLMILGVLCAVSGILILKAVT